MKIIIITLLFVFPVVLFGQSFRDFTYFNKEYADDTYLGIAPAFVLVSNRDAPNPEQHSLSGFSGTLELRKVNFDVGASRFLYRNKLVFDVLLIANNMINDDGSAYYRSESSGLTTGIIGWYSKTWNLYVNDRFCFALGGNLNDYFLTSSYRLDETDNLTTIEPNGYYFAAGPSMLFDYLINDNFILHTHASYSMSYWRAVNNTYGDVVEDDSYPKPHFAGVNIQLQSKWGVYAECDCNFLINRGNNPNKTKRLEFVLGFKLPL